MDKILTSYLYVIHLFSLDGKKVVKKILYLPIPFCAVSYIRWIDKQKRIQELKSLYVYAILDFLTIFYFRSDKKSDLGPAILTLTQKKSYT